MHSQVVEAALTAPRIDIAQWWNLRHVLPIGVVGIISWSVWLTRFSLSRLYRPKPNGYTTTTSAVIPAFREDPDILDRCLDSWLAEGPTEIIVVPDVQDREVIQRLQSSVHCPIPCPALDGQSSLARRAWITYLTSS